MRPSYLLFLTLALPTMAQTPRFTFGVKGGVPAQTPLGGTDTRMPFVLGPMVDVRISSRLSIETGVLFYRMGQSSDNLTFFYPQNSFTILSSTQSARAIEVPVLARIELRSGQHAWRPFLSAGPSIRRTSVDSRSLSAIFSGTPFGIATPPVPNNRKQVDWGIDPSVGAGVDIKTGRFHLEPEVRYSYWSAGTSLPVRKNQVGFLLGFRF